MLRLGVDVEFNCRYNVYTCLCSVLIIYMVLHDTCKACMLYRVHDIYSVTSIKILKV